VLKACFERFKGLCEPVWREACFECFEGLCEMKACFECSEGLCEVRFIFFNVGFVLFSGMFGTLLVALGFGSLAMGSYTIF
jgi:hypothetical protein